MENAEVYNDICTPTDGATYRAYCDGESAETSTVEIIVRGVVNTKCERLGFSQEALKCFDGEDAFRLSMTLRVDEANHQGCSVSFGWGVVPIQGNDRICSPIVCTSDKLSDPACSSISPIEVNLEIPKVAHEMHLETEQFSPYEYILLQQPEYFPQRKKHFPVVDNPKLLRTNDVFRQRFDHIQSEFSADDDDIEVWSVIDPNYETKGSDAFYCKDGSSDDPNGKGQCCFRGKRFSAADDDADDEDLANGLADPGITSPSRLDFCTNTRASYGKSAFAWSKGDESNGDAPKIYNCFPGDRCKSFGGFFPITKPYDALNAYVVNKTRNINTIDYRDANAIDPDQSLTGIEVAGIDVDVNDDDERIAYERILAYLYRLEDIGIQLFKRGNPSYNIKDAATLEAYHDYLARDAKNTPDDDQNRKLSTGAWVTTPLDGTNSRMRRLRCGYCSSYQSIEKQPCPNYEKGIPDTSRFKPCPFGDVSTQESDPANQIANPSTFESDDDGDGGRIIWGEIRHVRAFASSFWFLGTNPVCAAMKPKHSKSTTHTQVILNIKKLDPENPGDSLDTSMDLSIHDTNAYGRQATVDSVRADISPGESSDALIDNTNGAYLKNAERIIVCDSRLYDNGVFNKDHFKTVAPSDPFTNPYDSLTNPDATLEGGTCVGCTTIDQYSEVGTNPTESLLWYYHSQETYAQNWRKPGVKSYLNPGSSDTDLQAYRQNVINACGKSGVGMELFNIDGCDAIDESELSAPDQSSSRYILPERTSSCDALYSEHADVEQTCRSDVPFVMPDALACSQRLPRLCTPTYQTPAGWQKRIREEAVTARQKFNTGSDKSSFNIVDWDTHGFPLDVNLDQPNYWLGISSTSSSERVLYSTNKRNPRVAPKKKAWRESVINVFVTGRYAELSPVFTPCIYEIEYPSCILASPEADYDTYATGTFNFQLDPTVPDTIPSQEYVMDIDMGQHATCVLGYASQSADTYKSMFSVTIQDTSVIVAMAFRCDLVDPNVAIDETRGGVLTIQANHNPVIKIPIMSCEQQNEFLAGLPPGETIVYTPIYPANDDPCLSISDAITTRKGGSLSTRSADEENDAIFPASDDDDNLTPTSSPTPSSSATPSPPIIDIPDDTDNLTDDPDETIGPAKSPEGESIVSPSPTPELMEAIQDPEEAITDSEPKSTRIWSWIIVGMFSLVGVVIIGAGCYCLCFRNTDDEFDDY